MSTEQSPRLACPLTTSLLTVYHLRHQHAARIFVCCTHLRLTREGCADVRFGAQCNHHPPRPRTLASAAKTTQACWEMHQGFVGAIAPQTHHALQWNRHCGVTTNKQTKRLSPSGATALPRRALHVGHTAASTRTGSGHPASIAKRQTHRQSHVVAGLAQKGLPGLHAGLWPMGGCGTLRRAARDPRAETHSRCEESSGCAARNRRGPPRLRRFFFFTKSFLGWMNRKWVRTNGKSKWIKREALANQSRLTWKSRTSNVAFSEGDGSKMLQKSVFGRGSFHDEEHLRSAGHASGSRLASQLAECWAWPSYRDSCKPVPGPSYKKNN